MEVSSKTVVKMASKPNENCRFCHCSFKVKYGHYLSSENLFKSSKRSDSFGTVLADVCKEIGLHLVHNNSEYSDRCCNLCARKVRNLGQLYAFITKHANQEPKTPEKTSKRQLSPSDTCSPAWRKTKSSRVSSPKTKTSRGSLDLSNAENINPSSKKDVQKKDDELDSHLNVDDLPDEGLQVKIVTRMANGKVIVRIPRDEESKELIKHIAFTNWKTAVNCMFRHDELQTELKTALKKNISKEFDNYVRSGSVLSMCEPDEIAGFSNKVFMEEIRVFCPLWYQAVLGLGNMKSEDLKEHGHDVNAAALATATLAKARNATLSGYHYRISTVLFHSGARYEDLIRLNRLGICMSPDSIVRIQHKMGGLLENKVSCWKKAIEENRGALLMCKEIKEKQVVTPQECNGNLDLSQKNLQEYTTFTEASFSLLLDLVNGERLKRSEVACTTECLDSVITSLEKKKLPLYK